MQIAVGEVSVYDASSLGIASAQLAFIGWCTPGDIFIVVRTDKLWSYCLTRFGYVVCLTQRLKRAR